MFSKKHYFQYFPFASRNLTIYRGKSVKLLLFFLKKVNIFWKQIPLKSDPPLLRLCHIIIRNVRLRDFTDEISSLDTKPSLRWSNSWTKNTKSPKPLKFIANLIQIKDFAKFSVLLQEFDHRREALVPSDEILSVKSLKRPFLMIYIEFRTQEHRAKSKIKLRKNWCKSRFSPNSAGGLYTIIGDFNGISVYFHRNQAASDLSRGSRVAPATPTIIIYHLFLSQSTQESLRHLQRAPELEIRSKSPDCDQLVNFGRSSGQQFGPPL